MSVTETLMTGLMTLLSALCIMVLILLVWAGVLARNVITNIQRISGESIDTIIRIRKRFVKLASIGSIIRLAWSVRRKLHR